jgi:hypothetical protein
LPPPNYFLFPKVQLNLKGARFDTTEEIQKALTDQLNKIPSEEFSNAMKKFETRANLCIEGYVAIRGDFKFFDIRKHNWKKKALLTLRIQVT